MIKTVEVVRDAQNPNEWRVEAEHEDGDFDVAIFCGREAESMAKQHAYFHYNWKPTDP